MVKHIRKTLYMVYIQYKIVWYTIYNIVYIIVNKMLKLK